MLGLLGGTFDPVHVAHLRLAIEVRERVNLDEVRLIPAPRPRLRDTPQVDAQTRLRLLRAAVHGIQGLAVDDRELASKGPTRTVQTLHSIRQDEGSRPLCLILGADAAARLDRWHEWQQLIGLAHLLIARRPGSHLPDNGPVAELITQHRQTQAEALRSQAAGFVYICDIPALDISATVIRERIANGQSIEFLVPEEVRQILIKENLYATRQ
jgi:nicotinate-nucleotide adenylyltransferase